MLTSTYNPLAAEPCPDDQVCCALNEVRSEAGMFSILAPRLSCVHESFCGDGEEDDECDPDAESDDCGPRLLCSGTPTFSLPACRPICDPTDPTACGGRDCLSYSNPLFPDEEYHLCGLPLCGDGDCGDDEDLCSCPFDCVICGDGMCSYREADAGSCPLDCPADITERWVVPCGGTFMMGSPPDELGHLGGEQQHEVTLTRAFEILATEVTQEAFEGLLGYNPSGHSGCGGCPVEDTSWYEAASPWGLYDMLGNVWEWTDDLSDRYPEGSVTDPWSEWEHDEEIRMRGGSFIRHAIYLRAARWSLSPPNHRSQRIGFRPVRTLEP